MQDLFGENRKIKNTDIKDFGIVMTSPLVVSLVGIIWGGKVFEHRREDEKLSSYIYC